ncbi:hypothetical protein BDY21DRAFT_363394 [Lineolata rhizophorae]|uniref:Uncharacterized protein n=1 Tax=Lineolata rhizophorae TaxID=578093 RepID=A0A6A6P2U4_9PEZI|nr:hypothetical protein BDY21DRAFT_363394 [Lineolata rhizophorae]
MDFAPYQDASPERNRALSPPPPTSPRTSPRPSVNPPRSANIGTAAMASPAPHSGGGGGGGNPYFGGDGSGWAGGGGGGDGGRGGSIGGFGGPREDVDVFETRLGIRMDYEACLAYLLLPPAGGVLLLVLEHRSDYVRFHAWQSSLLFTFMFIVHVIFSWSSVISWLLFVIDLVLIAWLVYRAYRDADTLDRCEVPFFGPLASSILDDE